MILTIQREITHISHVDKKKILQIHNMFLVMFIQI